MTTPLNPQQQHPYPPGQLPPMSAPPAYPNVPPPPPEKLSKPKRFGWPTVLITAAGSWVVGFLMGVIPSGDTQPTASPTTEVTVTKTIEASATEKEATTEAPEPKAEPKPEPRIGDGTYLVGSEIERGVWKSSGDKEGGIDLCYADTETKGGDILSQEVSSGEPVVIRIGKSAYTFESSGCGTWKKVG